jgi:hypothetical protein
MKEAAWLAEAGRIVLLILLAAGLLLPGGCVLLWLWRRK